MSSEASADRAASEVADGRKRRHPRLWRRRSRRPPPGSPPGTLVPPEEPVSPVVRMIVYNEERIEERTFGPDDALACAETPGQVTWIDVQGLGDLRIMKHLAERFGLHPLVLADLVHVNQRAKVEAYDKHLFIVLRMVHQEDHLWTEQLSLILGENFVLTFQERAGDCFDPVRARLRRTQGRLRSRAADYLAYTLLDALIDSYFPVLEQLGEVLEEMERDVVEAPQANHITRIRSLKRDLLELRRALWPLRDAMAHLLHDDIVLIGASTRLFLRDCADHVFQLMDMIEIDREVASGLIDLHLSSLSMRMNEIMKVLTIIATIFIPLGFIAGRLRHEFQSCDFALQHARARLVLRLPVRTRSDAGGRRRPAAVFLAPGMARRAGRGLNLPRQVASTTPNIWNAQSSGGSHQRCDGHCDHSRQTSSGVVAQPYHGTPTSCRDRQIGAAAIAKCSGCSTACLPISANSRRAGGGPVTVISLRSPGANGASNALAEIVISASSSRSGAPRDTRAGRAARSRGRDMAALPGARPSDHATMPVAARGRHAGVATGIRQYVANRAN